MKTKLIRNLKNGDRIRVHNPYGDHDFTRYAVLTVDQVICIGRGYFTCGKRYEVVGSGVPFPFGPIHGDATERIAIL